MPQLSPDQYAAQIEAGAAVIAAPVAVGDLARPIPTCPDWTLRELAIHVGRVHRWARQITATRSAEFIPYPRAAALPEGRVLHVHATDGGLDGAGEWLVSHEPGGVTVRPGHGKGDVALTGPAAALLLVLLRRQPVAGPAVTVHGDAALLDHWLAELSF
jgi:MDMPI C-terminal domain/Mycothiol maleylpyruvate isomerase N-terminal domain